MAAKYAAVITYDGAGRFALAEAVKSSTAVTSAVDSGGSSVRSQGELVEAHNTLIAAQYTTNLTQYPSSLLAHAQSDALALAGTL